MSEIYPQGAPQTSNAALEKNLARVARAVQALENRVESIPTESDVTSVAGRDGAVVLTSADLTDTTAQGRALLDDATAADQRTTLGLGTAATSATGDFATASHTHDASAIVSGTLDTARLGSGTANGTTYLRGDQTWAAVTAGVGGSTGGVDNALLRADGTGGATMQSSAVTIDDSGNVTGVGSITCTAFAIDQTTYSGRTLNRLFSDGTNESVILSPSGTGYISGRVPDGGTAGGNQRGNTSVDLQLGTQPSAFRVAGGEGSFLGAGYGNKADGRWAGVVAGANCSGTGEASIAAGNGSTASGTNSAAFGTYGTASGSNSTALGDRPTAALYAQIAHAGGNFASGGDAQHALAVARIATADATPTGLRLDGSSARIVVSLNSSGIALLKIVARTNTAGGQTATGLRLLSWQCGATSGTLSISAVDTIGTDRGYSGGVWGAWPAGWGFGLTADTVNRAIEAQGTGAVATNVRWSMGIVWQETSFS